MALPVQTQAKFWGTAAIVTGLVLWILGPQLLPFVMGAAIAYFLDPVADRLEAWGLSRALAVTVISLAGVLVFALCLLLIVPALINQLTSFVEALPGYVQAFRDFLAARFPEQLQEGSALQQSLSSVIETLKARGGELLNTALSSAMSLVNVITLFLIVPVVTVYLLVDWDRMIARIDELLPRDHAPVIRHLAGQIDATLSGFIRGQGTVCLIMAVYYSLGLMLTGLNFGMLIGTLAGIVTFIPFVGAIAGGVLALGVAVVQFWDAPLMIALVAGVFFLGQIIEGNVITPKLVGDSVGLHPVWLLLALSVFGAIFGFVGLLVAVPLAAMIGVLVRFFVDRYKTGRLYLGYEASDRQPATLTDPASMPTRQAPPDPR
ncbi:AI-2E family transporter [Mangrovicoccus algicola]|uniref:AI-2E family transporter n=1 Tax=Mangrovicoccus algicola TaxID=2771008 RepID=A0A8J6YYA0_9RHOB|nr:AI-2E family transporter [Mangrovicoccus algicola]MBE3640142.1 AI-2E family transporter [Mangrovicoccus algicola]